MRRYSIFLLSTFFVLMFAYSAAGGSLLTDGNAYNDGDGMVPGDGNLYWRGSVLFSGGVPGWIVNANVEYAVYAPGKFGTSTALGEPDDPSGGADWVYAYQIFNNASDPYDLINTLTVGLDGNEGPNFISFLDGVDINPSSSYFPSATSAKWDFQDPNIPSGGAASDILFFTAPFGPETDNATLQGGWVVTEQLPSPVPEPATLCMMLLAAAMLGLWRGVRGKA